MEKKAHNIHAIITVAALVLAIASCGKSHEQRNLTLISYNVGVFSKYVDDSKAGIAALIKDCGASYVGLNELDSCNRRHDSYQVKELAAALGEGWNFHYASAFPYNGGSYGNGIVCNRTIKSRYRVVLPKGDGAEQRSLAVVETDECVFSTCHLDHRNKEAALSQMKTINDWMTKVYAGSQKPVFLCGDFNVTPDSDLIALAGTAWTQLSGTEFSFSTRKPSKCIDYIFALKSAAPVQVTDYKVVTEGTADLSDHFPLLVSVMF